MPQSDVELRDGLRARLEDFLERRMAVLEATLHSCLDSLIWDPDLFERNLDQGLGEEGQALRLFQSLTAEGREGPTLADAFSLAVEECAHYSPGHVVLRSSVQGGEGLEVRVAPWFVPVLSLLLQKLVGLADGGVTCELRLVERGPGDAALELVLPGLGVETLEGALVCGEHTLLPILAGMFGLDLDHLPGGATPGCRLGLAIPAGLRQA
ncbi:MAG: hypothetical protein R3F30_10195 [Planctomycetota bacterium]